MIRIAIIAAVASLASLPASAQSLDGNIFSNQPSGLTGTFQTGILGDFNAGFGAPPRARRPQREDFTLGAGGGFSVGFLGGQPSNYAPSVQAMTRIRDTTLKFDHGPDMIVDLGKGPADPLDGPVLGGSMAGPILAPSSAMPSALGGGETLD